MISFVGAGPGAPDLITVRGLDRIRHADVIVYAGSLVNPVLLEDAKEGARIWNSAEMTLEEVLGVMIPAHRAGDRVVRLHTGDPAIYGAIGEQMRALDAEGIDYEVIPGVSSFLAASAALRRELTLPDVSQTVIITRRKGRTDVPDEEDLAALAQHHASMAIFLSIADIEGVREDLLQGYPPETPVAIVYKASWPEERIVRTTVERLAEDVARSGIRKTAMILVGAFLDADFSCSKLYDPSFSTAYRKAKP